MAARVVRSGNTVESFGDGTSVMLRPGWCQGKLDRRNGQKTQRIKWVVLKRHISLPRPQQFESNRIGSTSGHPDHKQPEHETVAKATLT